MNTNDTFLNLYKRLENMLENIYPRRGSDSAFWLRENELKRSDILSKRKRAEIYSIARQVRNILSHNEINLSSPFVVSDELIDFLKEEIALLENEKLAIDIAVPFDKLLFATLDDNLKCIADQMIKRSITNVPILDGRRVIGILSGNVFIKMLTEERKVELDSNTTINDIIFYTGLSKHNGVRYEFVSANTRLDDLAKRFKRNSSGKTELIIVTKNGNQAEAILGVISPHSVLEENT